MKLHKKYEKDRANALILAVIAMPMIMLLLSFNLNIGKSISVKNIFNNTVQSATEAAVKTVNNRSVLGNESVQAFVTTYDKLIKNPDSNSAGYIGAGMEADVFRSTGECTVAEVNGVERVLPYMEISLSENRGNRAAGTYHTETWKIDGTTRTAPIKQIGNVKYKVINATVWEATPNFMGGVAGTQKCQVQKAEASAIAFGSQTDLEEQISENNKLVEPRDYDLKLENCAVRLYSISDGIKVYTTPMDHRVKIKSVKDANGVDVPYTDGTNKNHPGNATKDTNVIALDGGGRSFTYDPHKPANFNGSYVDIEYAFVKTSTTGEKMVSTAATIRLTDSRTPECAIVWPDIEGVWTAEQISEANNVTLNTVVQIPQNMIRLARNDEHFEIQSIGVYNKDGGQTHEFTDDLKQDSRYLKPHPDGPNDYYQGFARAINKNGRIYTEERDVVTVIKNKATGATKEYKSNLVIHEGRNLIINNNVITYENSSQPVLKNIYKAGKVGISSKNQKYFNYGIEIVAANQYSNWIKTSLKSKDTVQIDRTAIKPDAPTNTYFTDIFNYKLKSNVSGLEMISPVDIGASMQNQHFSIRYKIPTLYEYTYGVTYKADADTTTSNSGYKWIEINKADFSDIMKDYNNVYGIEGLKITTCNNPKSRFFAVSNNKGGYALTSYHNSRPSISGITNPPAKFNTAASIAGANMICYVGE